MTSATQLTALSNEMNAHLNYVLARAEPTDVLVLPRYRRFLSPKFDSDGSRTTITRHVTRQLPLPSETDTVSASGFEQGKAPMSGGPDPVNFDRGTSRSDVGVVRVDVGPPIDPRQNRGLLNAAGFLGTAGPDQFGILQETGTELAKDGNDTLIGHSGNDQLFGGAGTPPILAKLLLHRYHGALSEG